MTIYLYIKTHRKTGLKYLGKTTRNPYKYRGSGKYWKDHIKVHGYDVETVILRECQTKEELKEWGLYYSGLWDIVEAKDDNGKKIWANLKPEDGDGGSGWGFGDQNIVKRPDVAEKIRKTKSTKEHKEKMRILGKKSLGLIACRSPKANAKRKNTVSGEEYKMKVSGDNNILRRSPEAKQNHLVAVRSDSARDSHRGIKNSMNLTGVREIHKMSVNSTKERQRKSKAVSGKNNPKAKTYEIISPCGEKFIITGELAQFCKTHGLNKSMIFRMLNGHIPTTNSRAVGWTVKRIMHHE